MRQEFRDVRLDRLREERDHLKIRISLMEDAGTRDSKAIASVHAQLVEVEQSIRDHRAAGS
jgi:hypothetical protein